MGRGMKEFSLKPFRTHIQLTIIVALAGCAAADQKFSDNKLYVKARETSAKAIDFTRTTAQKSYARMQKYLAEKDVLKTFHDAGDHSEAAVLSVLHGAGIGSKPGPVRTPPPVSGAPKRPRGASGGNTSGSGVGAGIPPASGPARHLPPVPATLGTVPEQYAGSYRWPLDAGIISSEYGQRSGRMHKGLDIAADSGEPVYAVAAGEIIYAGDGLRGYGNVIIVRHDRKVSSLYAHNSSLKVRRGDAVHQGDLIALLGSTGHSTGPHVHFEFRNGDAAVNPHTLLPRAKAADEVATVQSTSSPAIAEAKPHARS